MVSVWGEGKERGKERENETDGNLKNKVWNGDIWTKYTICIIIHLDHELNIKAKVFWLSPLLDWTM